VRADPPPWPDDPLPQLARRAAERPVVVIDDDPTGTQTVRDATVMTAWDAPTIGRHLREDLLFLSANSRALDEPAAVKVTRAAADLALEAGATVGRPVTLVSRSDSTLRGHFPAETQAVAAAIGRPDARVLLAPYFGESGRVTVGDAHHLMRDGDLVNVADTEFARDATFGYRSRSLPAWVVERYVRAGIPAPPVASLPLAVIREAGPNGIAEALPATSEGAVVVVNAEVDRDIDVVALGALLAEEAGLPLVARTAASYVRARAGRGAATILAPGELGADGPGLIVVGSHVEVTTRQLERLMAQPGSDRISAVELPVEPVMLGGRQRAGVIGAAADALEAALAAGRTALVSTPRVRSDVGPEGGGAIASALVEIVDRIGRRPGWTIGKGGITSFELASRALRMHEARVAGQLLPGVPAWVGGDGSRWPGMPLVVFPGNVGDAAALWRAVEALGGP
jgi:uncharacterized protein YgbK (DUF1537 family)